MNETPEITAVLDFWFADRAGFPPGGKALWWGKSEAVDRYVRDQFGELLGRLSRKRPPLLEDSPRGRLASILCLDQFPRHLYRGRERAFAWDRRARALVRGGLAQGQDQSLAPMERVFFYLPLVHSEALEDQDQAILLLEALRQEVTEADGKDVDGSLQSARRHRQIIARFGRFPHRNRALGRQSSEEERVFLTQPGSSF
ncbi:DUF924 family protein [Aestuariirhabdus litorea]|uniref:DUF924 domain-containing protein n=1 Tax=Aestuariirhabdus litorea TaxID=2528527 RepID=A0A3P3VSF3_9GAMM|nr:DUF924 family protein [Aestuariirhabdus litorea]RRJ84429.1 DUF924 domain-containing protein [Aestuariirhabdus litorea]RWW97653.1 DUF924 family protein [Endozoicomonadaceae bacterium GTF-13]